MNLQLNLSKGSATNTQNEVLNWNTINKYTLDLNAADKFPDVLLNRTVEDQLIRWDY